MARNTKYTKDKLIEMVFENQKILTDQVERNISAFKDMTSSLKQMNDNNKLHRSKDDDRQITMKNLVESNNKFYKVFSYLLIILIIALIVLAGAEKALKFIPTY